MLTQFCSMLGLCRLQRRRMRRHREPAPQMHGRTPSAAGPREHDQLPPVPDAKVRHEPAEAEIKDKAGKAGFGGEG